MQESENWFIIDFFFAIFCFFFTKNDSVIDFRIWLIGLESNLSLSLKRFEYLHKLYSKPKTETSILKFNYIGFLKINISNFKYRVKFQQKTDFYVETRIKSIIYRIKFILLIWSYNIKKSIFQLNIAWIFV